MIRQACLRQAIWLALVAGAAGCGGSSSSGLVTPDGGGGRGGTGGAGSSTGGKGGSSAGTAGGAGGAVGTAGVAGAAGMAGIGGTAGTAGSGGAAGGTGGTAGTAGAGGAAGAVGGGGRGGAAGSAAGSAGTTGSAGATGGAGGVAGTTGGTTGGGGIAGSSGGSVGGSGGVAGASAGGRGGSSTGGAAGSAGAGGTMLDPTPGSYTLTCDGSMGVMIDATHFLDGNDEEQGMRLYMRGASGPPVARIDISAGIGLSTDAEADFEDAARVGDRIYVIGSHARSKSGRLDRARHHFFAMDVGGAGANLTLTVPGYTTMLLDQLLVAANWVTPSAPVLATLDAASKVGTTTDANLSPIVAGTNMEGLAWAPTTARPKQLLIGLRNPQHNGAAIVVSLLNADAVLTGATAQFGEATLLDLGGLGIRAMTWSSLHAAVLLIAGPHDEAAGPFRLYKWAGPGLGSPVAVSDITGLPSTSAPEAIITYPNTRDVQILIDQGDHDVGGEICKDADESDRLFGDIIINVP